MAKKRVVKAKKSVKKSVSGKKQVKKAVKTVKKAFKKTLKKTYSKAKALAQASPKPAVKGNLLVTFEPNHKGTAIQEIKDVFRAVGERVEFCATDIDGLFRLTVSEPRKAVAKLASLCRKDHNAFIATHHYIPVDIWTRSDVQDMQRAITSLLGKIREDESWKMNLAKRHWDTMGGVELILKLTDVVDRRHVDLDSPKKIIQVEIIGDEAGISVLSPNELLDIPKIKTER